MSKVERIFDQSFTARNFSSSPLTISGLEGDTYDYILLMLFDSASGNTEVELNANSDTTANYRNYTMKGASSTVSALTADSDNAIKLNESIKSSNPSFIMLEITEDSNNERLFSSTTAAGANRVMAQDNYWKNTADEITSLDISFAGSVTSDATIIIYRTSKISNLDGWEKVNKLSWSAESTEKSFTNLLGNSEEEYLIRWSLDQELNIEFNNDSAANYIRQRLQNSSGTISANNATESAIITDGIVGELSIYAVSGNNRQVYSTASNTVAAQQSRRAIFWSNSADEITSLDCTPVASATGTATLYRKKKPKSITDKLQFKFVEEISFTGDFSAGHEFSGLSGNSIKLIKIDILGVGAATSQDIKMIVNGDVGSNYTRQIIRSAASSASASNVTSIFLYAQENVFNESSASIYLFPKAGTERLFIQQDSEEGSTDNTYIRAGWWSNTADEITSIKLFANSSTSVTGTIKLSILEN